MIQSYFFARNFLRRNWGNWLRLRLRSNRAKAFVTVLLLLLPALSAFALRGHFTPTSEFQAFEVPQSQLATIYSFVPGNNISLTTNAFQIIYNPQSQNASTAGDTLVGSLSSPTAVSVAYQEATNVDAVSYPYFEVSVTTAPNYASVSGFSFGLRFLVKLVDGSTALEYNDKLSIEHVRSGTTSVLKVYVLNYDSNIRTIVGIRLYAEERAGISSNFSIRINSITASSMNRVPFCASSICYVSLTLPNATGSFDTLVADTDIAGQSSYNVAFYYANQTVISRTYLPGSSHVSLTQTSQGVILAAIPWLPATFYVISTGVPTSLHIQNLKLTFTPFPAITVGAPVPRETSLVLLFAELMLLFALPAELFILRMPWRAALVAGIVMRLMITPWTGHPKDTLTFIRTAYLYYHQGWGPIFYNPPTVFAQAVPTGFMQFYYIMGLDKIDASFLFHYGGVIATLFVKLPFLIADVASAVIISRISQNRVYGMFYFLNPFSIYVSAIWGQYEGLTTLALLFGYVTMVKLRPRLAALGGLGGFLIGGLIELFGFLAVPFLAVYLAIKKHYTELVLPVALTLLVILIPSSLQQFLFSFRVSSSIFQPNIYSLSGNFSINSQLPFIVGISASAAIGVYSLIRTSDFFSTLPPFSAAIISLELFSGNHPQLMLIPVGLMTLFFAVRNDTEGLAFVWISGAVLAFVSIAGTQSFAYLLTGEGYVLIPLIETGQHLKFYALSLLIVDGGLLARAYRRLPLVRTSLIMIFLVGLVWFLVNFA